MSKQTVKKFKKNDFSYEDEESEVRNYVDKRKVRRFDRALKTKNIDMLLDDDDDYQEEYKISMRNKH